MPPALFPLSFPFPPSLPSSLLSFLPPHSPTLTRTPGGMAPPPTPIYAFRQKKWTLITTKDLLPGDLISLAFKKRSNNPQVTPTVVDKTKIKNEKKSGTDEQVSKLSLHMKMIFYLFSNICSIKYEIVDDYDDYGYIMNVIKTIQHENKIYIG